MNLSLYNSLMTLVSATTTLPSWYIACSLKFQLQLHISYATVCWLPAIYSTSVSDLQIIGLTVL